MLKTLLCYGMQLLLVLSDVLLDEDNSTFAGAILWLAIITFCDFKLTIYCVFI